MTQYEKETTINFNDAEKVVHMFTANDKWMRKMDALCKKQPEVFKCTEKDVRNGEVVGKFYVFPKNLVSIRPKQREMTPEEKELARQRFKENLAKSQ